MIEIHALDATRLADFAAIHQGQWCWCVAWWMPTWDGWTDRTEEQNRALRATLPFDGYLAYVDGAPAGWCQVGPRDRLAKLVHQFARPPDPDVWAVSCFMIAHAHRGKGVATALLAGALADLQRRGVRRVEAYPKDGPDPWRGPERLYRKAGFAPAAPGVLSLDLDRREVRVEP